QVRCFLRYRTPLNAIIEKVLILKSVELTEPYTQADDTDSRRKYKFNFNFGNIALPPSACFESLFPSDRSTASPSPSSPQRPASPSAQNAPPKRTSALTAIVANLTHHNHHHHSSTSSNPNDASTDHQPHQSTTRTQPQRQQQQSAQQQQDRRTGVFWEVYAYLGDKLRAAVNNESIFCPGSSVDVDPGSSRVRKLVATTFGFHVAYQYKAPPPQSTSQTTTSSSPTNNRNSLGALPSSLSPPRTSGYSSDVSVASSSSSRGASGARNSM
ncbi:hypothetical protein HK102_012443, partial [Quaeritorhiza haematococci]